MKRTSSPPSLADIKAKVPVNIALVHYGVTPKPQSARLVGCCPIHGGSNPRAFVVSPGRRSRYCFGNFPRGGGVLDLVMALENCSLLEAASIISKQYDLLA